MTNVIDEQTTVELFRLPKDLKAAAATLGQREVRYLVDTYYNLQDYRKATGNQRRALGELEEPHETIDFFFAQFKRLEDQIKGALDTFSQSDHMGEWSRKHVGIGPVIAAGLSAHIDIRKAPTAGHIWNFAGLNPDINWFSSQEAAKFVKGIQEEHEDFMLEELVNEVSARTNRNVDSLMRAFVALDEIPTSPGEIRQTLSKQLARRPWNASLKTLCWKIGDSFCKFSNHEKCFYGHLYKERKVYEMTRNAQVKEVPRSFVDPVIDDPTTGLIKIDGEILTAYEIKGKWFYNGNAKWAQHKLATTNIQAAEAKRIYESGHLPPGHIEQRSRRWAVKLFLSHWHAEAFRDHFGKEPPNPYPIEHLDGHTRMIESPV
jgi:hypothetical protein